MAQAPARLALPVLRQFASFLPRFGVPCLNCQLFQFRQPHFELPAVRLQHSPQH
jgi:hypothetical protein